MKNEKIIELAEQTGLVHVDRRAIYGTAGAVYTSFREDADLSAELLAFAHALLAANDAPKQRESDATLAALADVERGAQVAPTARKHGIQPSTLFRAIKRRREAGERP